MWELLLFVSVGGILLWIECCHSHLSFSLQKFWMYLVCQRLSGMLDSCIIYVMYMQTFFLSLIKFCSLSEHLEEKYWLPLLLCDLVTVNIITNVAICRKRTKKKKFDVPYILCHTKWVSNVSGRNNGHILVMQSDTLGKLSWLKLGVGLVNICSGV